MDTSHLQYEHTSDTRELSPQGAVKQRRLAGIMFTDMVGYSALTHRNEALALELLEQHDDLMRQRFADYGGKEIKSTGDGFLVVFVSALDAVRCAVSIQCAIHERNAIEPPDKAFQVRIGIHVGDVVHRGDDVFGNGVNVASRLERLVRSGGICVSEHVADLTRNMFGLPMIRRQGKAELKNIQTPLVVYYVRLPWEEQRTSSSNRRSLRFLKRNTPSVADLINAAFIASVIGIGIWQSMVEHKAIHAVIWFGDKLPPPETRTLDKPYVATLSPRDVGPGRNSEEFPWEPAGEGRMRGGAYGNPQPTRRCLRGSSLSPIGHWNPGGAVR